MKRGSARWKRNKLYARARYGRDKDEKRVEVRVPWATTLEQATERAYLIGDVLKKLMDVSRADLVKGTVRELAQADTPERLARTMKAIAILIKNEKTIRAGRDITFKQWADRYMRGELAEAFPDHVRAKDTKRDKGRLRMYVLPHVGDVPVRSFTISHGNAVMSALPKKLAPASRRHVAQCMMRLMHLAVFPGQLIPVSPLPRGWLPRITSRKHYSCLYPREEAQMLGHTKTPYELRLFFGVLGREGMRLSELWDSEWWQWNFDEGTFMATKTKTLDPRVWVIRPDVCRVMKAWKNALNSSRPFAGLDDLVGDRTKIAGLFRDTLKAAGVTRAELFESTAHTGKLRAHDLRATFVTVSLAEGKTETWIRDRTAHKSTAMIDRYRRAARQFAELKLGPLVELDAGLAGAQPGDAQQEETNGK